MHAFASDNFNRFTFSLAVSNMKWKNKHTFENVCWAMMLKSESITVFEVNCNKKKKPYYARNDLSAVFIGLMLVDCRSSSLLLRCCCCWHSCCFIFNLLGNKTNMNSTHEMCVCTTPHFEMNKNSHNYNKQRCLRVYKSLKYISNMSSQYWERASEGASERASIDSPKAFCERICVWRCVYFTNDVRGCAEGLSCQIGFK